MNIRKSLNIVTSVVVIVSMLFGFNSQAWAASPTPDRINKFNPAPTSNKPLPRSAPVMPNDEIGMSSSSQMPMQMRTTTQAMRNAAALNQRQQQKAVSAKYAGINPATATFSPLGVVASTVKNLASGLAKMASAATTDYFGVANWTNSPLPTIGTGGTVTGGIHKFVDTLPGLGSTNANDLGQFIPLGVPDTTTFAGNTTFNPSVVAADYYEIGLVEYYEQLHRDLPGPNNPDPTLSTRPGTKLRGYVQLYPVGTVSQPATTAVALTKANGLSADIIDSTTGQPRWAYSKPQYLGPTLLAQKNRPVRVKFTNLLPTGPAGDLFIPVDHTYMGAGMGPNQSVKEINVTNVGAGYTSTPTVTFDNTGVGGTGAEAVANVLNGTVVSITVTNGGSGYTAAPKVTLTGGGATTPATATVVINSADAMENYTENRATLHLHGGNTPWISDGTPHQWTTPQGELTSYSKGVSVSYVPDMWFDASGKLISQCAEALTCTVPGATNDPGLGSLTFYWTNQQSGRLLFYHDHSYGITRLNVYAGEAAGYLIVDPTEEAALLAANVPGTISNPANLADPANDLAHLIPLIIQDKTFVPDDGAAGGLLAATDPTWDVTKYGGMGNLWLPHVWMPNQNPADISGSNAYGRWDYGPWFWPAQDPSTFVPSGQPYNCTSAFYGTGQPAFPPLVCPGIPNPSGVMEAMMDTPLVNGTAYPSVTVDPTTYRFQMLNAGNDRALNLALYVADPLTIGVLDGGSGYTSVTPPTITINPSNGATATAILSNGGVTTIALTDVGKGYTTAPAVTISAPATGGVQATATATVDPATGTITAVKVTNPGSLYSTATVTIAPPPCTIDGTTCIQALATATVTPPGVLTGVALTVPAGVTWTSVPAVTVSAPPAGGTQAYLTASINSEVKMVDAVPHSPTSTLPLCNDVNELSGANLVLGFKDATGNPLNGTGLPASCYPASWPTDGRDGGVPDPLTAGPAIIQIGNESGLLPAPVVIPSTPVGYEYNRKSITVLNIFNHGLLLGPAQRAEALIDFSQFAGKTIILYNDAPAPVPAFDPRNDYYTGGPDQTMSGGAPSTLPGYGPNTRTIMQIKVNATVVGTGAKALNLAALDAAQPGIFASVQHAPIVPEPTNSAPTTPPAYARIQDTSITGWYGGGLGTIAWTAGAGYGSAPTITVSAPNMASGTQATINASFTGGNITSVTVTNGGSGYTSAPTVGFTGGNGSGAAATAVITLGVGKITVIGGGSGYTTAPTVTISAPPGNGVRATATAVITAGVVTAINVTNPGSGYTSAPSITISRSPNGSRATATATLTGLVRNVIVTSGGSGYSSAPTVTFTGGNGSGAAATATIVPGQITNITVTNPGSGYTALPTVTITGGNPTTAATVTLNPPANPFLPKAIQELFTLDYGRMNATFGVEVPFTNFFNQTTIPYGYIDPPTEMFQSGDTVFWKITHNGVDTHFIHFHLFDVQVINRVGWDGMIKPPDANEVGWNDTVRMNPLEDIIVALRPMQQTLPWSLPNSIRPLDVTMPIGMSNANNAVGFTNIDTQNNPVTITNDLVNFGWEYVWHCHILEHEEIDMMRPMSLALAPAAPSNVTILRSGTGNTQKVLVSWQDNSINETGFSVQRATNMNGPWVSFTTPAMPGSGKLVTYTDTALQRRTTYYYRVVANNLVGYTQAYAGTTASIPTLSADSAPVYAAGPVTTLAVSPEETIFSDSFESGLDQWGSTVGDVQTSTSAVAGPYGGKLGMAAKLSAEPAYVAKSLPSGKAVYTSSFYFDPNGATTELPVDIFLGLDQNGQPIFGVQYQGLSATSYQLRAWVLQGGETKYTDWWQYTYEEDEDAVHAAHKIDVAWQSDAKAGFSFYVDNNALPMLIGNTSASQLQSLVLGPTFGVTAAASGTMFFDEFSSSTINGVQQQFQFYLPAVGK